MARWTVFRKEAGLPGVRMLGRYRHAAARSGLAPHSHRGAFEICFLSKGRQTYGVDGRLYRMKGGDQFITWPGELHDTAGTPQEKGELTWLILDLPKRERGFLFLSPAASLALVDGLRRLPVRHFRADAGALSLLDRVFRTLREKKPGLLTRLEAAQCLVDYLLRTLSAARRGEIPAVSVPIRAALDFLEGREGEWLQVPELAAQSGLSVPRFKARFRSEIGMPPGEYMLRRKVDAARVRLAKPGAMVTEVAYDLGFSSSQYFATVFKRYTLGNPSSARPPTRGRKAA